MYKIRGWYDNIKFLCVHRILSQVDILSGNVACASCDRFIRCRPRTVVAGAFACPGKSVGDGLSGGTVICSDIIKIVKPFIALISTTGGITSLCTHFIFYAGNKIIRTDIESGGSIHKCIQIRTGNNLFGSFVSHTVVSCHKRIFEHIGNGFLRLCWFVRQGFKHKDSLLR